MDEQLLQQYENAIAAAQNNADVAKLNQSQTQQDVMIQEQEGNMIREQLDSSDDIQKIYNLLQGYSLERNDKGRMVWTKPKNNDMIILTPYGIQFVMGKIVTYLTKNTLLSNYDDKQIMGKMEDISSNINDTIFMEYDKMFLYPTLKDCQDELRKRITNKIDLRIFAKELLGQKANKEEIEKQILKEMEEVVEREMTNIKEQKMKSKLKRFESLVRDIQDVIHSAYQRAWKGQERTTLRQHIHISENKGNFGIPMQQQQGFSPLNILRRK